MIVLWLRKRHVVSIAFFVSHFNNFVIYPTTTEIFYVHDILGNTEHKIYISFSQHFCVIIKSYGLWQ